ncbi:MAG: sigma-54-dependent Fis family transcriptional regulator [Alphaproteobacteria bacterium]|nr:sigma-54-dependent Fis family transcriptional regulator [Alphaproteobacteria bacterium]
MANEILVVDDERDIRELVAALLADEGYEAFSAADSRQTLAAFELRPPALVILDIWLEGSELDGLELLEVLRTDYPDVPVLVISGHGTIETAVAAIRQGAYDFIEKPFTADRLLLAVRRAIEAARLRRENEELRLRAGQDSDLLGESVAAVALRQAIDRVAPTGSRVLVMGPPGSGKEVATRYLHRRSKRAAGPFVVLNAARLGADQVEIELFGAEAGADRPSSPPRIGLFERAHEGTLFIDEVADMPIETQGRILRALQEQTFTRIGGAREIKVDVRVVSASSRNLQSEIAAGRFREDLFHRLSVVPIRVPALSDRRDDIPLFARYFMERTAHQLGLPPREFGDDAVAVLQAKDWPGNVRELRNVIERLLIMTPGRPGTRIRADTMPPDVAVSSSLALRQAGSGEVMAMPLRDARERFEREYLLAQINRFGGNVSRTAAFVGMERSALHRKLKALGVNTGRGPGSED